MPWPWVGRGRLDDALRELATVREERDRYLKRLLGDDREPTPRPTLVRTAPAAVVPVDTSAEDAGLRPVSDSTSVAGVVSEFSTPFDRVSTRFRTRFRGGARPPAEYRVTV